MRDFLEWTEALYREAGKLAEAEGIAIAIVLVDMGAHAVDLYRIVPDSVFRDIGGFSDSRHD